MGCFAGSLCFVVNWLFLFACCSVLQQASCEHHRRYRPTTVGPLHTRDVDVAVPLLECIEVAPPVLVSSNKGACQQVIMSYSFANSYNAPFVGPYQPPSCTFNRVIFNFTVTAAGRQFDRLAVMYLNDTEIFRTSTAEPTSSGIIWTYVKDMSNYLSLFKQPQKIIFDLGNIVDKTYTAPFNATLTASYYNDDNVVPAADLILPISAKRSSSNAASAFNYPDQNATGTLSLPQNLKKAVFSISACGQIGEEFWWSNVLTSDIKTFPAAGDLYGYSPFREVQLYIDGSLAGVSWPFPVIFTGGVVPGFWRPIVGIDAFDLREDEIDITPWLPLLADGKPHTFSLKVAGINDNGRGSGSVQSIGSPGYWVVTGKVFIWLDKTGSVTTGSYPIVAAPAPSLSVASAITKSGADNDTLSYSIAVQRQLSLTSTVITSEGTLSARWEQNLGYENVGNISRNGEVQYVTQRTHGTDISSSGYSRTFSYPLYVYSAYKSGNNKSTTIDGIFDYGKDVQVQGQLSFSNGAQVQTASPAGFVGSDLHTRENGSASYFSGSSTAKAYSYGSTEQDLTFSGLRSNSNMNAQTVPNSKNTAPLYHRHILAVNGTVIQDSVATRATTLFTNIRPIVAPVAADMECAEKGVRQALGRGPSPKA